MSLLTKYRPSSLDQIVGQQAVVKSLRTALKQKAGKAFLFIGPSGCGKTTLARIVAADLGCLSADLLEYDGATNTGIDSARDIMEGLRYRPLGEGIIKAVILDECQAISRQSWHSMLKMLEDPPSWVYWFLCTTEGGKIPENIKTRCLRFDLKPVSHDDLSDLLDRVLTAEDADISDDVWSLIIKEAHGSPRQLLANLGVCLTATNREEAAELLSSAEGSSVAIDLARALYAGNDWAVLQRLIGELGEVSAESVRHVVRAYGTKVVLGAKNKDVAGNALMVLDAFAEPFNSGDGITPVLLACGRLRVLTQRG